MAKEIVADRAIYFFKTIFCFPSDCFSPVPPSTQREGLVGPMLHRRWANQKKIIKKIKALRFFVMLATQFPFTGSEHDERSDLDPVWGEELMCTAHTSDRRP